MEQTLIAVPALLLVSAVVAMLARRVRLPYSVGLLLTGLLLARTPLASQVHVTKELIFTVLLPPLVFEAALAINWGELRRDLVVLGTLATVGVLISAAVTAAGMYYLAGWGWGAAAVFGVLIAATDPVAVLVTFKDAGVVGRLRLLVEAESLLNDGTAAVAFTVALAFAIGQPLGAGAVLLLVLRMVVGGIVCGLLVAGALIVLAGHTSDHLVELTFTTVAAYGAFLLAEALHLSGVFATLSAGLLMGNMGLHHAWSEKGQDSVDDLWEYLAFAANSMVFLLMGIRTAEYELLSAVQPALIAILLVMTGRAAAIYPCAALFGGTMQRLTRPQQHALWWGGLRGALAMALALGLPVGVPQGDMIVAVTLLVVTFSVCLQGLTVVPVLRRIGAFPA
ncbi:MAG: sodium:proton antiporter [Herpetosiphonaceae bacterium]|nr:sodium:proton antiporter [Herpetosiphonaceae bacterium]